MQNSPSHQPARSRVPVGVIVTFVAATALSRLPTFAEPPASASAQPKIDRPDTDPPNPETARLQQWVGSWALVERHFDAAGKVVATAKGQEDIIWILDKHAIRRSYGAGESGFRANGALAWSTPRKNYEGMWFDNAATNGPTRCRAEWKDESKTMVYTLESVTSDGKPQIHRCVEQWLDDERRTATTFRVQGDSLVKLVEVEYKRTTPCPAKQSGFRMVDPVLDEKDGK